MRSGNPERAGDNARQRADALATIVAACRPKRRGHPSSRLPLAEHHTVQLAPTGESHHSHTAACPQHTYAPDGPLACQTEGGGERRTAGTTAGRRQPAHSHALAHRPREAAGVVLPQVSASHESRCFRGTRTKIRPSLPPRSVCNIVEHKPRHTRSTRLTSRTRCRRSVVACLSRLGRPRPLDLRALSRQPRRPHRHSHRLCHGGGTSIRWPTRPHCRRHIHCRHRGQKEQPSTVPLIQPTVCSRRPEQRVPRATRARSPGPPRLHRRCAAACDREFRSSSSLR